MNTLNKSVLHRFILSTILTASTVAFADSPPMPMPTQNTTLYVSGMHCGGCEKMIQKTFCDSPEVQAIATSCKTKLTDEKKQTGEIALEMKAGQFANQTALQTVLSKAGDYKFYEPEISTAKKNIKKTETKKK